MKPPALRQSTTVIERQLTGVTGPGRTPLRGWWPGLRRWLSTLARIGLAAVFAAAALAKIGDVAGTVRAVRAYQILPESLVHPLAYALPYLELAVALLLLIGLGTRIVAALAGVMVVLFIAAVSSARLRGLKIDCGCFGGGGAIAHTHYLREIARDSLLLLLVAWLVVLPVSRLAADTWIRSIE